MNIIGKWKIDSSDRSAIDELGNVTLNFKNNGKLIYTIEEANEKQTINLIYKVDANILITDQPSAPQIEKTNFSFQEDGKLILEFNGVPYRFCRL